MVYARNYTTKRRAVLWYNRNVAISPARRFQKTKIQLPTLKPNRGPSVSSPCPVRILSVARPSRVRSKRAPTTKVRGLPPLALRNFSAYARYLPSVGIKLCDEVGHIEILVMKHHSHYVKPRLGIGVQ